jgi:selenocysteine-specific elongation factor
MREIVLGTAGHVDHGKTSFVRALTGQDTDRLKEEKKRGITIELGFAWLDLPCGHRIGIVDVPGHEKFVKTMVSGVSGIDIVAFIVAADEGIMPQTVEHFEICRLMGVQQGIVVVTKKDMVDADWLEMVNDEITEFCEGSFLEGAPMINVSSTTGEGIEDVSNELDRMVRDFVFQEVFGPFRLPVDRCFAMKGFGTVVTGTSISGRMKTGDSMRFFPSEIEAKVRGIQVHGKAVEEVEAGHRTAVNLQGVVVSDVSRGMVLAPAEALEPSFMLDTRMIYLSSAEKPLPHRARVRVDIGSTEVMGRVSLLDREELQPGDEAPVQLLLEDQVAVWPQDRFVIRSYSPVLTIGGGEVLGNVPPRKRKRLHDKDREANQQIYDIFEQGELTDKILLLLEESREQGLTAGDIGIRIGLFGNHLKKALQDPLSTKKISVVDSAVQRYVITDVAENVKVMIVEALTGWHKKHPLLPGIVREELRSSLPRSVEQKVFNYCLNELVKKGEVVQEDSLLRLAGHEVALKADEKALERDLLEWLLERGLKTPTIKEIMEHFDEYPAKLVKEVMDVQLRDGGIIKVSESLYYAKGVIEALIEEVKTYLTEHGDIDAQGFKEMTGLSRKFSIPILEYLDRVKITMRIEDRRCLRKQS